MLFTVNFKVQVTEDIDNAVTELLAAVLSNDMDAYESLIHTSAIHEAIRSGYLVEEI
jgi:hypothetical protein